MIKYIKDKRVIVITNNGKAIYTEHSSKVSVILSGGELREIKEAMVGEFASNNISKVTAKKSFIGCSGLSLESGMTTEILSEVNINQLMLQRVTTMSKQPCAWNNAATPISGAQMRSATSWPCAWAGEAPIWA